MFKLPEKEKEREDEEMKRKPSNLLFLLLNILVSYWWLSFSHKAQCAQWGKGMQFKQFNLSQNPLCFGRAEAEAEGAECVKFINLS